MNSDYQQKRKITDSTIIMDFGETSSIFRESYIPNPFFGCNTYVTSSLLNLQHNIGEHKK